MAVRQNNAVPFSDRENVLSNGQNILPCVDSTSTKSVHPKPLSTQFTSTDFIQQITSQGYCHIPTVYSSEQVDHALSLIKQVYEQSNDKLTKNIPFLNRNHPMVYNLENKDAYFLEMLFAPQIVHQILMHFLNDKSYRSIPQDQPNYILRSFLARSSRDALPLHIDSFMPYIADESFIMQVAIVLEDQDEENGCTIVMPRSHQSGEYADRARNDECIPLYSKAGDVLIWDSRLWHGTLANVSETRTRWAAIATLSRWWIKQNFNTTENVPQSIYEQLTDNQKAVVGFCSIPFCDETQGIDIRQGHDALLPEATDYRSARQYHHS
ncbi:MAG: phytanoyl-CoA dioxygenase family protein [Chloroflexota bacterium]